MNIESILGGNNHIIIKKFTIIFFFSLSAVLSLAPFHSADQCIAANILSGSFAELAKKTNPAVVRVEVEKTDRQVPENYIQKAMGTGFIIDKEGHILTAHHIVAGADDIKITLSDKTEYQAKIIGLDSKTDLALIKVDAAKDLVPLALGDSDKIEVGDRVVTIGNPLGFDNTFTVGTVSAKHRRLQGNVRYQDYIQTDAFMYPGSTGGPLINTNGDVIGINSAIFSAQKDGNTGIGFAIPINIAKKLLPQLKKGKVVRGWLGVAYQPVTPIIKDKLKLKSEKGALVEGATPGGPADKAGLKQGDLIITFDGKEIREENDLSFIVASTEVGETVSVEVIRNGDKKTLEVKIEEWKE